MCPQGVTSFISPAWGGRVSDKLLIVNSGFLSKLLPGDCVLVDRGFDVLKMWPECRQHFIYHHLQEAVPNSHPWMLRQQGS